MCACKRLYAEFLHTDQVIWLLVECPPKNHRKPIPTTQYLHTIEADRRDYLAVVDTFIWEHIIGHHWVIPYPDLRSIRDSMDPTLTSAQRKTEEERRVNAYLAKRLPQDLWSNLLIESPRAWDQVIMRCPFRYSWIADVIAIPATDQ